MRSNVFDVPRLEGKFQRPASTFAIPEPVRDDTSIRYRWLSLIRWYDERVEQHLGNAVAFAIVQILFDRLVPTYHQALIYIQNQAPCVGRPKTTQVVVLCPDLAEAILGTPSWSIGEGPVYEHNVDRIVHLGQGRRKVIAVVAGVVVKDEARHAMQAVMPPAPIEDPREGIISL